MVLLCYSKRYMCRRGDIPSAAVCIRALSVRSADGQVQKPGRTADGCGRNAHGQCRRTADGQRTDGARTSRSVSCPCASVRCPCASVRRPYLFVRPQGARTNQRTWTDSRRMRTECGRMRTANNKTCRPSYTNTNLYVL